MCIHSILILHEIKMADPIVQTGPTPNPTDINLNLNFDNLNIPAGPEKTEENLISESNLDIDFSDVKQPETTPVVQETTAPVVQETAPVVQETTTPVVQDNRLAKEDKIVEENTEKKTEEKVETVEAPTPTIKTELPSTSLQEDQKIIDEITSQNDQPPVTMDLDSLLWWPVTPTTQEVVATTVINENIPTPTMPAITIPTIPVVPASLQTPLQVATIPTVQKSKSKKIITSLLLIALVWSSAYVLKTMYPLEYNTIAANVMSLLWWDTTNSPTGGLENMLEATGSVAETGTLDEFTGTLNESTTWSTNELATWSLSTSGFNAFEDLETILTGTNWNPALTELQLAQLRKFSDEAKTFLELGNKTNDKTMIKYWTYVSKKSDWFIQSIENKEQIDNAKIDNYLAQFSGYLYQLTTLSYDSTNAPAETTVTTGETTVTTGETTDMIQDINREWSEETGTNQEPQGDQAAPIEGL